MMAITMSRMSALKTCNAHAISWVLNPLSHSQTVDRYHPEIEDAIFAVAELESAVKRAICFEEAAPVMLRRMLLTCLSTRTGPNALSAAPAL